nr:unnamed protein product [Callosobruchus chinensis]
MTLCLPLGLKLYYQQ